MKYLDIEIYRCETLVFGKVIYMSEMLRNGRNNGHMLLWSNNNFHIGSYEYPCMGPDYLHICGLEKECDSHIFYHNFSSIEKAKEAVSCIKEGVKAINYEIYETGGSPRVIREI